MERWNLTLNDSMERWNLTLYDSTERWSLTIGWFLGKVKPYYWMISWKGETLLCMIPWKGEIFYDSRERWNLTVWFHGKVKPYSVWFCEKLQLPWNVETILLLCMIPWEATTTMEWWNHTITLYDSIRSYNYHGMVKLYYWWFHRKVKPS